MKTLLINKTWFVGTITYVFYVLTLGLISWQFLPTIIQIADTTAGVIDGGIWQLLLFCIICFITMLGLCIWLFYFFIMRLRFPRINSMVLQFKNLTLWQQFALYWASFALLFLASILSLIAVF